MWAKLLIFFVFLLPNHSAPYPFSTKNCKIMIKSSELIINSDGTVFHLHLLPGEVATTIILVGDPARCDLVASHFDTIELTRQNREMRTITGALRNQRISVVSTGIGCDNIDIVLTELDALFNVDFASREAKEHHTELTLIRLGTSGALSYGLKIGDYALSKTSFGIDGLAYFYADSHTVRNIEAEEAFIAASQPTEGRARPYAIDGDKELIEALSNFTKPCNTLSASGFYGPQGRVVRLGLSDSGYIEGLERAGIDNLEMEGSAIYLLSKLLGHRALTICSIIAQRTVGESNPNYKDIVEKMISKTLDSLIK